jgi:hypothetical protein
MEAEHISYQLQSDFARFEGQWTYSLTTKDTTAPQGWDNPKQGAKKAEKRAQNRCNSLDIDKVRGLGDTAGAYALLVSLYTHYEIK